MPGLSTRDGTALPCTGLTINDNRQQQPGQLVAAEDQVDAQQRRAHQAEHQRVLQHEDCGRRSRGIVVLPVERSKSPSVCLNRVYPYHSGLIWDYVLRFNDCDLSAHCPRFLYIFVWEGWCVTFYPSSHMHICHANPFQTSVSSIHSEGFAPAKCLRRYIPCLENVAAFHGTLSAQAVCGFDSLHRNTCV